MSRDAFAGLELVEKGCGCLLVVFVIVAVGIGAMVGLVVSGCSK